MRKLYAIEDNESNLDVDSSTPSLIDKVLEYSKKPKDPISVTADVIKQRNELKKDIQKQLDEAEENEEEESNDDNEDSSSDDQNNPTGDEDTGSKNEDIGSLVGSELNQNTSNESYQIPIGRYPQVFKALKDAYQSQQFSLESFNLPKVYSLEEQPITYLKEPLKKSLDNLIQLSNEYIGKNKTYIDQASISIKSLNEKITVMKELVKNRSYHFTNKLISDTDILAQVSIADKSNLRDTIRVLLNYLKNISIATNYILSNPFEQLLQGFKNSNFALEGSDLVYKDQLPGFITIRVGFEKYESYIKNNIENFEFYKVKHYKAEDLYRLNAIGISEDKELDYLFENIDKLVIEVTLMLDNFNVINDNLNKLIDELKVLSFDIEGDKYSDLASLDIDKKIKDLIRFKLLSEMHYTDIDLTLGYVSSVFVVLSSCVELKN